MRLKHFWLALIAIGASGAAHAAMECKFNDGNTRTIMPGMSTMIVPLPPGTISVPTQISPTILLEFDTPLQSSCNVGNDGESVWQMTDNALLWGNVNGHATFRTNVEGIYYTLAIYPDANTVTAWFPRKRAVTMKQAMRITTRASSMPDTGTLGWIFIRTPHLKGFLQTWSF